MSVYHSPRVRTRAGTVTRRRRRRWFSRALVARWLLAGVVVTVALVIGCSVVSKILRPIRLVGDEKRKRATVVSNYLALRRQNQDLRRQLHYLQTPDGIAQEARKQGFVKPGEISLVISEDNKDSKPNH